MTPTSYLELILTFKSLLKGKRDDILNLKTRYEMGLGKLEFASSQAKLTIPTTTTILNSTTSIISGDCDAKRADRPPPPTAGDKRRDREVDDQDRAGHYSGRIMMIKMMMKIMMIKIMMMKIMMIKIMMIKIKMIKIEQDTIQAG